MSNKQGRFASRIPLLGFVILAIVVVFAASYALWKLFPGNGNGDGQTLAAWIQAIGSISAIVGALWINERQTKAALASIEKAQSLDEAVKRKSILAIAEAAHAHAKNIEAAMSSSDPGMLLYKVYDKTIINGVVRALTGIPVHEVGSRDGVMALLSLTDQFVFLGKAVDSFIEGPTRDADLAPLLESYSAPEDREERLKLLSTVSKAFAQNVQIHLNRIFKDYASLEKSINAIC